MQTTVLDHLLAIASLFQQDMERSFAGTSLTQSRLHALWVLAHQGPSTQQTLSASLDITPRSVSALVDGLVSSGYVERRPHPDDRRAVLVTLTTAAERMMERMREDHRALTERLLAAIAPEDHAAFSRGVDAVLARLQQLMSEDAVTYSDVEGSPR